MNKQSRNKQLGGYIAVQVSVGSHTNSLTQLQRPPLHQSQHFSHTAGGEITHIIFVLKHVRASRMFGFLEQLLSHH